ncbi:UvrD-helicase domain-containing protein, partial [Thiolapillus sp.]
MALSDLRGPSLIDSFTRLLGTFLRKYKNGGYSIQDCENKARALKSGRRAKAFLNIFEPVYQEYQKRLGERIDFEDMILRAAHYAEIGRYDSPFHHILVDEFQDISQSRARLIKALRASEKIDYPNFVIGLIVTNHDSRSGFLSNRFSNSRMACL